MKNRKLSNGAATNSMLLMLIQVVTTLMGLIVAKLLAVNFSLEEYGTYSQALLVTTTATSLSILGLTNATNYFYNKTTNADIQKKYISTIFAIQYLVGALCYVGIIVFRGAISRYFSNDALRNVLLIVAATPCLTNLIAMYQNLFVSIGQARRIAARNLVVSCMRLIAVSLACFLTKDIVTVLRAILLMDIGQTFYFARMFGKIKFTMRVKNADFALVREILSFSIPMAVYVLTNSLTRDIDKYVISAFSDTQTLAIYTNAAKILPFDMLTSSLITVLVPIVTRLINNKQYNEAQDVFKLYLRIGYTLTGIFVGGAIAVANPLMIFLYDEKYISGLPIFVVYLFIDLIRFANVTTVLSGAGKTKVLMRISVLILASNAVFNVISFKMLGLIGPAITTLVLTVGMTGLLLYYGAKQIKSTFLDLFDWKEMLLMASEILLFGVIIHFLSSYLQNVLVLPLFFVLAISYGLYLIALLGLNGKRIIATLKKMNTYK